MSADFLSRLRAANVERCLTSFGHPLESWSIMEWACALAGEAGELCNVIKKLKREQDGIAGSRIEGNPIEAVGDEMADVVIYMDLLAARLGIDLQAAIANKFNKTSDAVGYRPTLTP